jgi:hypothetical protein
MKPYNKPKATYKGDVYKKSHLIGNGDNLGEIKGEGLDNSVLRWTSGMREGVQRGWSQRINGLIEFWGGLG